MNCIKKALRSGVELPFNNNDFGWGSQQPDPGAIVHLLDLYCLPRVNKDLFLSECVRKWFELALWRATGVSF